MGPDRDGHVDPVIHQQERTGPAGQGGQVTRQPEEFTPGEIPVAELNSVDAAAQGGLNRFQKRPAGRAPVGDEREPEGNQRPTTPSSGLDAVA